MEQPPLHIRFGHFELDEATHELRADGVAVAVEPKPLALLLLLARNRHRVVRREEILGAVWPGVAVSEDALSRAVLKAREALGEVGAKERVILTVRAVGFRFVAPVEEDRPAQKAGSAPHSGAADAAAPGPVPLIGRERELARLDEALRAARAGAGRVALLSGTAGIGKTRLAAELVAVARSAGVDVHQARARERSGAPALWLWSQVLRSYAESWSPEALRSAMGEAGARELARVLPALREKLCIEVPPAAADGDEAQFHLLDALTHFLMRAARERPQMIVLEDVHWADAASLRALGFLGGEIADARILVLVTCREEEIAADHPLTDALSACARDGVLVRVPLPGLDASEVGRLVEALAGFTPSADLARAIHERTGGNPFFVRQIVDLARAEHPGDASDLSEPLARRIRGMPPGVRQVVGRRLAGLSPDCRRVLAMAAVWGREFPVAGLARLPGISREQLLAVLGEATEAHVIEPDPGPGRDYCFAHDLLQQVIDAELEPAVRVRLHLHVAEALESLHAAHLEPVVPALAYHYGEAALLLEGTQAVDYARQAGELAREALSYEEAAQHFERGLRALDLLPEPDLARRAELLVCLGYACQSAGRHERGREVLREAAIVARRAGSAGHLAMAAVGLAEIGTGLADADVVSLLEESLRALGASGGSARLWLQCMLAANLATLPGRLAEAMKLAEDATLTARELGDARSRSMALASRAAVQRISPETHPAERLAGLTEAAALASGAGDVAIEMVVRLERYGALVELADLAEMEAELGRIEGLLTRLRSREGLLTRIRAPYWNHVIPSMRAMRHQLEGRFAEAEALADEAFASQEKPQIDFVAARLANVAAIRKEQGRMVELLPVLAPLAAQLSNIPALRAAWMLALLELGRTEEARAAFAPLADRAGTEVVGTESWLCALALLAEVCARLGDAPRAAALSELLAPRAGQCIIVGNGHYCHGPVALYLGLLACTCEDFGGAEEWLALALERSEALRSPVWRAHTLAARARMLLARGERGDRAHAQAAGCEALGIATRLGMEQLRRELEALGVAALPAPLVAARAPRR